MCPQRVMEDSLLSHHSLQALTIVRRQWSREFSAVLPGMAMDDMIRDHLPVACIGEETPPAVWILLFWYLDSYSVLWFWDGLDVSGMYMLVVQPRG